MRSSLPIVASDVGGVSESVIDNYNGYCVSPCNATALADSLQKLILESDLRVLMGSRSRELFESRFTFERMAECTFELYKRVVRE